MPVWLLVDKSKIKAFFEGVVDHISPPMTKTFPSKYLIPANELPCNAVSGLNKLTHDELEKT